MNECNGSGEGSAIPRELIEAFLSTEYRVGSGADMIALRIGERSSALERLYAARGCDCAAFITACNPRSTPQANAKNAALHAALCGLLRRRGIPFIEGAGVGEGGGWREQSVLALGVPLEEAQALGRELDQNAIVWIGADAVPQLCLLR